MLQCLLQTGLAGMKRTCQRISIVHLMETGIGGNIELTKRIESLRTVQLLWNSGLSLKERLCLREWR